MKTLNLSVWAALLFAFLLSGCKKDLPIGQDVEQVWETGDIETREAIFFDTDYAKSLHNIPYTNELHADLLARVKMRVQGASVVNIKESVQGVLAVDTIGGLGLPCWSCGEYGMSLATHTSMLYVPILSTSGAPEVKGILLFNIYGPKTDFYFLESHKWIAAPQSHFALVANFFEKKIIGGIPPDTEPQFLTAACELESHIDDDDPVSSSYTCICRQADYRCSIQEEGTIYNTDPCYNSMCVPDGAGGGNSGGNNGNDDDTGNDPNTGDDPNTSGGPPIIIIIQGGWIGGPPNQNDNPGGNGGIALDDSGYFNLSQINDFEDYCVALEVNQFKARHENLPNAADILIHLRNYCDFEDCLDYKNGLRGFTSCEEMPECVKAILRSANMATLANEDDLVLSAEEYDAIFGNLCRGNFSSYKKTMLINYMKNVGGFGSSTESQLNSLNFKYAVRFYQYLNAGDFSPEIVDHAVAVVEWIAGLDFYVDDAQFGWLLENVEAFQAIFDFGETKGVDEAAFASIEAILSLLQENKLAGPYTIQQRDNIILEHFANPDQYVQYITHCILLRAEWENNHPGQTCGVICETKIALEAYWKTVSGVVHTALDICGLIPAAGEPCDLINGTLYFIEGDGVNATLSFAAAIPIAGWLATGAKWVGIAIETAPGVYKTLKVTLKPDGLVHFSHNSSTAFREILNMTGSVWGNFQAHHIMPKSFWSNPIVQKAAQSKDYIFHMNHPKNGIPVDKTFHNGSHPNYSNSIENVLGDIENAYPDLEPEEAAIMIDAMQQILRTKIDNQIINSTTPVNINNLNIDWSGFYTQFGL